ncbi:MAG: DUF4336 domain-containing protein [Sandaracinaceae bacterium]|nr:DUF4336 domain-containing protein [Sandaracinaceae bacterium]
MRLRNVGEDIWVAEHDFRMGLLDFGGRMTVVRLADGLLLYSVIAIDDALAKELAALGPVAHLVAPNAMHHVFLDAAIARYPDARVYAPRALAKKKKGLEVDAWLEGEAPPAAWGDALALVVVQGAPSVDEVVLFHRASRTLIVCDLVFHIHEARGWVSPLMFKLMGVWRRVKQGPLWRFGTKDRAAAEASLEPVWGWDFTRVIVAHGRLIEGPNAKAQLAEGLAWMCPGHAPKALPAPA